MISDFDYLTSLKATIEAITDIGKQKKLIPLDSNRFKVYYKNPSDIDDDTLKDLADLVDGKMNITPKDPTATLMSAPSTLSRLMNSLTIIYVMDDGIPVGILTLVDPVQKNFQGIIPQSEYTMKSGYNLDGRILQEFFVVADDYLQYAVAQELCAHLKYSLDNTMVFSTVDETDKFTIYLLKTNGYKYICTVNESFNEVPIQLWINVKPVELTNNGDMNDLGDDMM